MPSIRILPSPLFGTINAVPSKSETHRAVICALLSRSVSSVSPVYMSDDICATVDVAQRLGAVCKYKGDTLNIDSTNAFLCDEVQLDCYESGSTLRFMIAVCAALGIKTDFTGHGRLPSRPLNDFYDLFPAHGADMSDNHLPMTVSGKLKCGKYVVRGDTSSQFITGLLLGLPMLDGDSEIVLSTALESEPYVDMTIETMSKFGVFVTKTKQGYRIKGNQQYQPRCCHIEGDWSQAAFFLEAAALGGNITLENLNPYSMQGDKEIVELIKRFGADIRFCDGSLKCKPSTLNPTEIDAAQIPDLVPAVAVVAAFTEGKTRIYNAKRLRFKESDRIKSVCAGLKAIGCNVTEYEDGMEIVGGNLHAGEIDCCNDHRIAMSFSIAASFLPGETIINGYECINKSYPDFYKDLKSIGGVADVVNR